MTIQHAERLCRKFMNADNSDAVVAVLRPVPLRSCLRHLEIDRRAVGSSTLRPFA